MTHLMIDLETLGTAPDTVILSIGAVFFSMDEIGKTFEQNVHAQSCIEHGLQPDGNTIYWWLHLDEKPRQQVMEPPLMALPYVLYGLNSFISSEGIDEDGKADAKIWCRGPDFDLAILCMAYKKARIKPVWKYNAGRDIRTLESLCPKEVTRIERAEEDKHAALSDAIHQARCVQNMWRYLARL